MIYMLPRRNVYYQLVLDYLLFRELLVQEMEWVLRECDSCLPEKAKVLEI